LNPSQNARHPGEVWLRLTGLAQSGLPVIAGGIGKLGKAERWKMPVGAVELVSEGGTDGTFCHWLRDLPRVPRLAPAAANLKQNDELDLTTGFRRHFLGGGAGFAGAGLAPFFGFFFSLPCELLPLPIADLDSERNLTDCHDTDITALART
jgi:hypothetical protein